MTALYAIWREGWGILDGSYIDSEEDARRLLEDIRKEAASRPREGAGLAVHDQDRFWLVKIEDLDE